MQRFDALFTLTSFVKASWSERFLKIIFDAIITPAGCTHLARITRKIQRETPTRYPARKLWLILSRTGVSLFNGLHNPEKWLIHKVKILLSWPFNKVLDIHTYIYILYIY